MPGQRTTPEERVQIVARAREQLKTEGGLSIQDLVGEFGRNYDTIKTVLTRTGVITGDVRMYSLKNKDRDAEIVRLYTIANTKLYEVAKVVGCSEATVRKVLHKNDVRILSSAHVRTADEIAAAGKKISAANLGRKFY